MKKPAVQHIVKPSEHNTSGKKRVGKMDLNAHLGHNRY